METVKVEDVICVLKHDKDLLSNWERFLTNLQIKSIGEKEKADLKADFQHSRDGVQLINAVVSHWVLENGNGATVKSLGQVLKSSGLGNLKYKLETTFQPSSPFTTNTKSIKKPGCVETLFQIINWSSGGGKEEYQLFLPKLLEILSNIGAKPVTIISINGTHSSYNSTLTDRIIKYLKFEGETGSTRIENGFSSLPVAFEAGSGIRIWNEPLYISNSGKEIGVIVMEQNGTNPITTAFSLLLSSVSIYLGETDVAENVVQWFNTFLSSNDPKLYPKKLYQTLSILCLDGRSDFQQNSDIEISQLKVKILNESLKQLLPTALENYFDEVNCDTVGIPEGNLFNELSACPTTFLKYFENQFSSEKLANSAKQVCGKQQTGSSLKDYTCLWAQLVTASKGKLRPKTIQFDTEKTFASNLTSQLLENYRKLVKEFFNSSPNLTDEKFNTFHSEKEAELINELVSLTVSKSIKDECKSKFLMNAEALKCNFITEIHEKCKPQMVDASKVISIKYDENQVLGKGSKETIVYKGTFGDRHVAVKRLNKIHFDIEKAKKEVDFLIKCDSHQNVVQLFYGEVRQDCYLIALELCDFTMEDWMKNYKGLDFVAKAKDILLQTTEGLAHLHRQRIIHRDIKPQNILLRCDDSTKTVCVKISDFGISKYLSEHRLDATFTSGLGTEGWVAPEILQYQVNATSSQTLTGKLTMDSDIFSLGCVFYYVMTKGGHPFGDVIRRQANILNGKQNLDAELLKGKGFGEAECLIKLMLSATPMDRPPASAITKHYLLWTARKISSFLVCTNKCWEAKNYPESSDVKNYLEKWKRLVFNQQGDWGKQLDLPLQTYLAKLANSKKNVNKHNFNRVDDMIRLVRNIEIHQTEGKLPQNIMNLLGLPGKYVVEYFTNKFPFLIPVTWLAFQKLKNVPAFKLEEYYPVAYGFDLEIGKQLGKSRQSKRHRGQNRPNVVSTN
ncbi:Serine/threonine-protein kinase/endoribonuclease IRE2 [Orchesella cincta]|uniref:non-specific serine/threonine protein kinase n=1 Tax=Orchesella cincta TaxID=48709 RepID=A0A1D2MAK1_ORCCI|nr:Serine/threonine-protein kinase/endoribonuclease IRE2 [Orchesella cincta]